MYRGKTTDGARGQTRAAFAEPAGSAVLVIGPIVRNQGERYEHRPIRGDEAPPPTNGSAKPSRAAASSGPPESQVAAPSGTLPEEPN